VKNLLFDQWDTSQTPNKDVNPETFVAGLVHFTTRPEATNPRRIHNYQISVLAGNKKNIPEEVGSIVMYRVEEELTIHVWAIAGIGDDYETVENNLRTMLGQIDFIIRTSAATQAASGLQFVKIAPGERTLDDIVRARVFHRIVTLTAIYYRTELPAFEFAIGISPTSVILAAGQETTAIITAINALPPIPSPISLTFSVSPAEPTIYPNWWGSPSISLGSTTGSSGTFSFAVTTKTSTPVGTYAVVVKGTSGSRSHTDTLVITINQNPAFHTFKWDDGTKWDDVGVFS
jgi:hypothetical protein